MLLSRLIITLFLLISVCQAQVLKKTFKFSTFYIAANGNTSLADRDIYSVQDGAVLYDTVFTPFDYSLVMGIRKIKRFGYEDITKFKDGTESAYGDAASVGLAPFEYLFQANYKRQEGVEYLDQHHFVRYVKPKWLAKVEYIKDGFADIEYFESTQRLRLNGNKKLSFNIGVQRLAEPYGFDPLEQWQLENNYLHYTCLAIEEGYSVDVYESEYKDPDGNIVATSSDVWKEVVIPQVLENYVEKKRNELANQWQHSLVVGFDYYYYKKNFWLHSWGNLMPYHYDDGNEFSYHNFNDEEQWYDYSGGLIVGAKITKHLGVFVEGKYNKYWNREWYDFKCGINYVIF
jgi:hypothetical protein